MSTFRRLCLALLALTFASPALAAPDLVLTVGSGCDHPTVELAYAAVPVAPAVVDVELRLVAGDHPGTRWVIANLAAHPEGFRLKVRGGFPTCSASTPTGQTRLLGDAGGSIVQIHAGVLRPPELDPRLDRTVVLENVNLEENVTSAFGAGLQMTAGRVVLRNSLLKNLTGGEEGGAIHVGTTEQWIPSLELRSVEFVQTEARDPFDDGNPVEGGAIYCKGIDGIPPVVPEISGFVRAASLTKAVVHGVPAEARGGFAYVENCRMDLAFGRPGIRLAEAVSRDASARGGVLAAIGVHASVEIRGVLEVRVAAARSATTLGGGLGGVVYAEGSGATVDVESLRVIDADAAHGGVVHTTDHGTVAVGCVSRCSEPFAPSLIELARADFGGGIFAVDGGHVSAHNVVFSGPRARVMGAAVFVDDGSGVTLSDSRIARGVIDHDLSEFSSVFEVGAEGSLHLARTTTAENADVDHLIGYTGDNPFRVVLDSSVFAEVATPLMQIAGTPVRSDGCVAMTYQDRMPTGDGVAEWTLLDTANGIFDAEAIYEYRLSELSPARSCTPDSELQGSFDLDGDPARTSAGASDPLDRGSDEYVERTRHCLEVEQVVEGVGTFPMTISSPRFVRDLRVIVGVRDAVSGPDAEYRVELEHAGRRAVLDDEVRLHQGVASSEFLVFDDEPDLPALSATPTRVERPEEDLRRFDGHRTDDGPWTLRLERLDDLGATELDAWCLEIVEKDDPGPRIFHDGFESGDLSAWGS